MTRFNTGNPVGSADPRDRHDNSQAFDQAINSDQTEFQDRLGKRRLTVQGMVDAATTGNPAVGAAQEALSHAQSAASDASRAESGADRAELAKDAAFINADVYADISSGLAAVSDGAQFQVVDGDEVIRYERVDAGTASEVTRYPASKAVLQPKWAGKINGWIDPFFRDVAVDGSLYGRVRWSSLGDSSSVTLAQNPVFDGRALQKTLEGSSDLSGPVIHLDDLDAAEGDTIAVKALIVGSGGNAFFQGRFRQSPGGVQAGSSVNATPSISATSAVPQIVTIEATVPAGATVIEVYPYFTTVGETISVVALWAHKGGASAGPNWPIEYDYPRARYQSEAVDDLTGRVGAIEGASTYAIDSFTAVSSDAESVELSGTGFTSRAYDLPFAGWGETYSPAGISFNALRIKQIERSIGTSSQWRTLRVVVRTGVDPHLSSSTVVAVGSALVVPTDDVITDVDFVLKDPVTGQVKTLSDTDFGANDYFIGVYAQNLDGAPAACGLPQGEMPNTLGQSYYVTNSAGDPGVADWSSASGSSNRRVGFLHLSLTNPSEGFEYSPSQALANDLGGTSGLPVPEIVVPPTIYGVEGRECNVYLDNLHLSDASEYLHDVDAEAGIQQNERFTWLPDGAMTSGTLSISVHDKRTGSQLVSASADQRAAAASAGTGATKKVLVIGDSLVAAGGITQTLLDIAGSDVMSVQLLGTQGGATNKHEGRGGWSVNKYTTEGTVDYRFSVSGVSVAPAIGAAEYSHDGSVYRVEEVDLDAGAGTITCSVVSGGAPLSSGTLTKSNSADGDATITFSASEALSANPFWIGGTLDFGQYLVDNSVDVPDWVFIQLGTNDVFSQSSDAGAATVATSAFSALDALIDSIKAADPGIKVGLMLPPPPSADQDSFGSNYATGQARWRFKRNILIWAREMITNYSGQEASRIYLVPSNTSLDTVNNMRRSASEPVNSRSSVTVERQSNGVHPATDGYQQIGDAVWAFLKCHA